MGGYLIYVSHRSAFYHAQDSQMPSWLPGTSKERAPAFTRPRQGGPVGVPTQGVDSCAHPAIVPLLSLTPPNLIEALHVLQPLSYYMEYLLESTRTGIPTFQVPFISAQETLECLALYRPGMRGRYWLPQSTRTCSHKPCPPSHSKHFPPNQAILREFVQFNCE